MAKIKDCVVIDSWLYNQLIEELNDLGNNNLACTLHIESKPLEPIVRDAWKQKDTTLYDYLNEKEI